MRRHGRRCRTEEIGVGVAWRFTDRLGLVARSTYDPDGNRVTETDANGHTTVYTYDAGNSLLHQALPTGHTRSFTYDRAGNRVTATDPNGHTVVATYDARNRLTRQVDPVGQRLARTYDAVGNVLTETDAFGSTSHFAYDALNRRVAVHDPLGQTLTTTSDPVGNRIHERDKRGIVTTFTNHYGQLTNGVYVLDTPGMASHTTGSLAGTKSQFLLRVNEKQLVLDAAA